MQFSIITVLAATFAVVNAVAIPGGEPTSCSTDKTPPATSSSALPSSSPTKPPTTSPTTGCAYTCTGDGGLLDALNCVNILTGTPVVVPITVGKAKRNTATDYCCKPSDTLINLITCTNIATGSSILLPVTLFPN